ncbi:MAG: DUF2208 family protein [Sulfolobales archaeon]
MSLAQILKGLAFSQVMILAYSLVLTFFPQYYQYIIILVFITFLSYSFLVSFRRMRSSTRSSDAEYVRSGRVFVKAQPSKVIELINKDDKLIHDMRPQMRFMASSLIALPIVFIIYYPYIEFVMPYFRSFDGIIYSFIGYLILFELLFMTPWIINRFFIMKGDIRMIQPLRDYIITSRGIQATGLLLKFPADSSGYKVYCNKKRRFIDIEVPPQTQSLTGARIVPIYRLYMSESDLLKAIECLEKFGGFSVRCE